MVLVVLSVVEQRLDAVRAVLAGESVVEVAARYRVARSTLHRWIGRYLVGSVAGLADRPHRPRSCPHQVEPLVDAVVAEITRTPPGPCRTGRDGGHAVRAAADDRADAHALAPLRFGSSEVERWPGNHMGHEIGPEWLLSATAQSLGGASRQVVAQGLEQAPAASLAVRPVGPELVEEDAVLDVREPGSLVDRLELE
ncbi:MAG: Integrase catalytic region [Propionibacteriaceae bacterium]|jgi:hypothetical protein|nr:Integrase catalytic region [Propionibacteriaceae bacterium]